MTTWMGAPMAVSCGRDRGKFQVVCCNWGEGNVHLFFVNDRKPSKVVD